MSVGIIPDATRRWNGALLGHREKVVLESFCHCGKRSSTTVDYK